MVMDKFIRIQGIASVSTEALLVAKLGRWPIHTDNCILFAGYSDFDIPLGTTFLFLVEKGATDMVYPIRGELIQITQSFLKYFDEIPRGHKTICEIKLDAPSLNLLRSKLPVIDAWGWQEHLFLLATGRNINERNPTVASSLG